MGRQKQGIARVRWRWHSAWPVARAGVCAVAKFRFQPPAELQFVERHPWIPALGRGISRRRGRPGFADGAAGGASSRRWRCSLRGAIEDKAATLFRAGAVSASGLVRDVHRAELFPLVPFLGTEPDPGVFPDQACGADRNAAAAATQFFIYTMVGSVAMLLVVPGDLSGRRATFRFHRTGRAWRDRGNWRRR